MARLVVATLLLIPLGCRPTGSVVNEQDGPAVKTQLNDRSDPSASFPSDRSELNRNPPIPKSESIDSIIAECYGHPLPVADTGPFTLPRKHFDELLSQFRGAEIDPNPWCEDDELGTMRINLVGGRVIRVCWFWQGKGAHLSFSCGGIRYKCIGQKTSEDETLTLDAAVRRIHDEVNGRDS